MGSTIEDVIFNIRDEWLNINGIVGVGQGKEDDKDCILVFVSMKTREIEKAIPSEFKGYPVKIIDSGIIRAEKHCKNKDAPENVKAHS